MISMVLGTRPEIIKMSPIIRECTDRSLDYFILHSGQHYSYEMDKAFFDDLELPAPKFNLDVGSGTHAEQTGRIMVGVERVLKDMSPDIVLVQGDTNTVLAASLVASKMHIMVGHVEAGLRSFDRSMPEEINRVLADHVSDALFVPTEEAKENLLREGITKGICVTGNTIVDAVFQTLDKARIKSDALQRLGLCPRGFILATVHRQENVDEIANLRNILSGLGKVADGLGLPVVLPVHPRTRKMIDEFGLHPDGIACLPSLGFLDFLLLESNAEMVLTDSGGVQEEACILKVPCVTLRDNTERPETLKVGSNVLAGTDPDRILEKARSMMTVDRDWENPFGDGTASRRIIEVIRDLV
jgi:UDP-N-acetylglucosamine 2-epimerase (non-hydrolysing)